MDHLELRTVQQTQPQPQEIDVDEILREYGLDDAEELSTVIQTGDSTITIPAEVGASSTANAAANTYDNNVLEPPPVLADAGTTEAIPWEDVDEIPVSDSAGTQPSLNDTADEQPVAENATTPPEGRLETEEALKYLLPINTKAIEVDETTSRFSGAAWFKAIQESTIVLAGVGGIGSFCAFVLSRMKPLQIFIYDDDVVERANMSGQLYSASMVGKRKVDAIAQLVRDFSEYNGVIAIPNKFTEKTAAGDIMICGFDNMEARKIFFNVWLNHVIHHEHPENCLYIDGRLNMEEFQVFCLQGNDSFNIKRYTEEYLFSDWQAESEVCSMKQTTYCANMIGSIMINLFTNFVSNKLNPVIERDLPFKTYYDASMMYLKTEN